jgi:anti-sigma factor RsiW
MSDERAPEVRIGAALDRLDPEQAAQLLDALESEAGAAERLKAYARQKRWLRRSADALTGEASPATEALTRRLGGRLRTVAAGRWIGALAVAVLVGLSMGQISDRLIAPAYYGFETADSRVVETAPSAAISLSPAEATPARLSDWIHRTVVIPDLREAGLTFSGAKLVSARELKLVGLVYKSAQGELVLCQSPDLDGQSEQPEMLRTADVQAGYWSDGSRTFALVAGLNRPGVRDLVQRFSRLTLQPSAETAG